MTTDGDLVFDIESIHKKPYEILIIGRFESSHRYQNRTNNPPSSDGGSDDGEAIAKRRRLELKETNDTADYETVASKETTSAILDGLEERRTGCHATTSSHAIPCNYTFMCVPSTVHSQKPYIGG